jgi:hypothetical protein
VPPLVVTDPAAARFLSDVRSLRLLEPFLDRDCSVKEASEALGLSLQSMHYRVGRMVALDLIAVVGSEPRRGRPIKRYRAVADSFFVPLSLLDEGPDTLGTAAGHAFREQLARGLRRAFDLTLTDLRGWGIELTRGERAFSMVVRRGPDGESYGRRFIDDPDLPAASSSWHDLWLEHDRARALMQEIYTLIGRYQREGSEGGQRYLLRFGFAPVDPPDLP